jgi:hypothetical protein
MEPPAFTLKKELALCKVNSSPRRPRYILVLETSILATSFMERREYIISCLEGNLLFKHATNTDFQGHETPK